MTPPPDGGVQVRGGPGGVAARLEDLDRAAVAVRIAGGELGLLAARLGRQAADPLWSAGSALSPGTFITASAALAAAALGPHGVAVVGLRALALGDTVALAVAGYRFAEAAAATAADGARMAVGRAAGELAVPALLPLAVPLATTAGLTAAALTVTPGEPGEAARAAAGRLGSRLAWEVISRDELVDPLTAVLPAVTGAGSAGAVAGLLLATGRGVAALSGRRYLTDRAAVAVRAGPPSPARPPTGVADLVGGIPAGAPGGRLPVGGPPVVRVLRIDRPGAVPAWVVQVPGTSSWGPVPGRDPFDLTGDLEVMAGHRSAAIRATRAAMSAAGIRPGEPVLLAGHSQGGLVAASIAADPQTASRYHVAAVVVAGAPVAAVPVPREVPLLALEHREDPIPRLDGAANPATSRHVTVTRAMAADPGVAELRSARPLIGHDLGGYRRTAAAVDASTDPGLVAWRAQLAPFLDGPQVRAVQQQVVVQRVSP